MSFAIQSPNNLKCPFCWHPLAIEHLQTPIVNSTDFFSNSEISGGNIPASSKIANINTEGDDDMDEWGAASRAPFPAAKQFPGRSESHNTPVPPPIPVLQGDSSNTTYLNPHAFNPDGSVRPTNERHTGETLHCEYCKQAIPRDYLMRNSFSISLVGVSNAGKTSFLAAMTERFTQPDLQSRFRIICQSIAQNSKEDKDINALLIDAHQSFQQKNSNQIPVPQRTEARDNSLFVTVNNVRFPKPYIFKAGVLRTPTQEEDIEKVYWNLTTHSENEVQPNSASEINLVFHDIVGGFLEGQIVDKELLDYLNNNDGRNLYLIMYDPALNSTIIDRHNNNLMGTDRDELEYLAPESMRRQPRSLSHLDPGQYPNRCSHAPLVVILVTKFDMFKRLFIDFIKNGAGSESTPQHEEDAILFGKLFQYSVKGIDPEYISNLDFIWRISDYLKSFLSAGEVNEDFFSRIDQMEKSTRSKRILCLPISALGGPVAGIMDNGAPYITSYRPIWVEIVMQLLWDAIHKEIENS